MTKRVKLTEKHVRKAINEISYGTVDDANSINRNLFWNLQNGTRDNDWDDGFDHFYDKLSELEEHFESFTNNFKQDSSNPNINKIGSLIYKIGNSLMNIRNCSDEINKILQRKERQRDNFDDAMMEYDTMWGEDNRTWDEYRNGEINNV